MSEVYSTKRAEGALNSVEQDSVLSCEVKIFGSFPTTPIRSPRTIKQPIISGMSSALSNPFLIDDSTSLPLTSFATAVAAASAIEASSATMGLRLEEKRAGYGRTLCLDGMEGIS